MQARYKAFRHELFTFLTAYSDAETRLPHFSASLHVYLNDFDVCIEWEDIVSEGRRLIDTALKHARSQLQDQASIPVIDAMRINSNVEVIEEFAPPLCKRKISHNSTKISESGSMASADEEFFSSSWNYLG